MRNRYALPLFVAISVALYWNSFSGEFVFDDLTTFRRVGNARKSVGDLLEDYRPLRYVSLRIDQALFSDDPRGYHVHSALLHGITSFVVFLVLRRLAGGGAALAGALLFVAHPVHTECVAYISGRRDILTTLFYLLGFLSWLEFRRTSGRLWLAAGLGAYGLALGAKEMAVTLPAVCVLRDLLADPALVRQRIRTYAALGALGLGAAVYFAFFYESTRQDEWHGGSMAANFATSTRLVVHYAILLVFPLRLLGDHSFDAYPVSRSFLEGSVLLSLAAIAAGVGAALWARRRAPLVAFGVGWFLVTLLPVLHFKPFHELAAEHYLYLPSVGFCLLAGLGFERLRALAGPPVAWTALGLVLALFSVRTVVRNRDWRDIETFWRVTTETAPRCARAHMNLGVVHAKRREWTEAAACMERAISIKPDYVVARYQLGKVYGAQGRVDDARAQWEEALRLAFSFKRPPLEPAELCKLLDRHEEAIRIYERNLELGVRPASSLSGLMACHAFLGTRAAKAGQGADAMSRYRQALQAAEALLLMRPDDRKLLRDAANLAEAVRDRSRAAELRARADRAAAVER